jgi:hypothetical protein
MLASWLRNIHVAVAITAIFFALVHLQFFGILPRLILGLVLGYFFVWTGSIWVPVFFHFLNNASAVLIVFLSQKQIIHYDINEPMNTSYLVTVVSLGITALLILYLAYYYSKKRNKAIDWICVYESSSVAEAEIIRGKLEDNGIQAVVMNKRDSVYTTFGEAEVMVSPGQAEQARQIIENTNDQAPDENE